MHKPVIPSLSCLLHLSPIILNPAILSPQLKITVGRLISLLQTDSFKSRYIFDACVWQVWPHFLWHLCWQHGVTTDTCNCIKMHSVTRKSFPTFIQRFPLWPFHWVLFINLVNLTRSENATESDSVDPRGGHKSQIQSVTEIEITNEY